MKVSVNGVFTYQQALIGSMPGLVKFCKVDKLFRLLPRLRKCLFTGATRANTIFSSSRLSKSGVFILEGVSAPVIVRYVTRQRLILSGLTLGAAKGSPLSDAKHRLLDL